MTQVVSRAFPGHAVLGEEGGVGGNSESEYLWIVDPIDGTTNFAHGYPSFAGELSVFAKAALPTSSPYCHLAVILLSVRHLCCLGQASFSILFSSSWCAAILFASIKDPTWVLYLIFCTSSPLISIHVQP